jgi:alginate O-acetyltransferase complex protein AlgI
MSWPIFALIWVAYLSVGVAMGSPSSFGRGRTLPATYVIGAVLLMVVLPTDSTQRLLAATACLYFVFKLVVLMLTPPERLRKLRPIGWASLAIWPGMDPAPFEGVPPGTDEDGARFTRGVIRALFGVALLLGSALARDLMPRPVVEFATIASILLIVHLGLSDIGTSIARAVGWNVRPLFEVPWRSRTLSDFWTRRWNRPFVELDRLVFLPTLTKRLGLRGAVFAIFLISGILHELAISFPAGAGWGGPMAYFVLHGALMLVERKLKINSRIWVIATVLLPLPILMHEPFRASFIWPLTSWLHDRLAAIHIPTLLNGLCLALGVAQLLVLLASFQVPTRMKWREELAQLSSLNRKLMWTYGSFIVFTIVSWGVLTILLRSEMVAGTTAGLALAIVIFLFWTLRLGVDTFYFKSSDWPPGPFLAMGHTMLNCLFLFVWMGYGVIILR